MWRLEQHDEVGSTQDLALAAARRGDPGKLAILAQFQTAGRGRKGREWVAPTGNLNFSALLRPEAETLAAGAWSLLAGVAVYETVACYHPTAGLMLKWPNDVMLDGGKLGGVLIDSALRADGQVDWVVIGVGVNLAVAPAVPGRRTACLADYVDNGGTPVGAEAFATRLLQEIDRWRGVGFDAVREAWLARAHPVGTILRVHRGAEVIEGAFMGLMHDGRLRLENAGETASGDVEILGPVGAQKGPIG
jgi:BirA family biotin operon repressor/biotin-[acetyl-CoA-carboxylase] ligase